MKKIAIICISLSLLSLQGCDFIRAVAGRPTSSDLALRSLEVEAARVENAERKRLEEERKLEEEIFLQSERQAENDLAALGIRTLSAFRFGTPVSGLSSRYNLIVGVYRTKAAADRHYDKCLAEGFSPSFIVFEGDVRALCLCGSDRLSDVVDAVSKAAAGICPADSWVYVNRGI